MTSAGMSLRTICALQTEHEQITYGELVDRCVELRAKWLNSNASRVGVWVNNSIDSFVGIHALNATGRSVALFRGASLSQNAAYVSDSGVDHVLNQSTWTLDPVAQPLADDESKPPWSSWGWEDTLFYIQSSGTTGGPKWLPLTTRQIHLSAFGSAIRLGHLPGDRWLNPLAPGYMGWLAVLTRCALYGTTMRVCDYTHATVSAHLDTGEYTQVSLVPSMLSQLVESAAKSLRQVRTVLVGGGPTSDALLARCRNQGVSAVATWGMTEAASQVATQHVGSEDNQGHVGPPMPFVDVAIQDGRFILSGPLLNEPLETRDVGSIDAHGRIHVYGRVDDMILSSGHKVSPNEVEALLMRPTEILGVCVFGIQHRTWGQLLCAVIVPSADTNSSHLQQLLSKLIDGLPSQFKPRRVWQVDHIPMNQMGKPLRSVLGETLFQFDEVMSHKRLHKLTGERDGFEGLEVDGSVSQSNTCSEGVRTIDDVMPKDQRPFSNLNNPAFNTQFIALPNGFMEVTLRVNEGQPDRMCVKELIPVPEDRKENFLEGDMGVFEDTTKKNDASAVNLVESGSKVVTKGHDVNLLWRKGKAKL
jgi:acyl-CoA synthetase (AMP-forming)/AMP-acid ligase II